MAEKKTATERLRRLLDERGVEYEDNGNYLYIRMGDLSATFSEFDGMLCMTLQNFITPEQAIAATVGSDDVYTFQDVECAFVSGFSLGRLPSGSDPQWNQREQTVDEHMAELGWVRISAMQDSLKESAEKLAKAQSEAERHEKENSLLKAKLNTAMLGSGRLTAKMVSRATYAHSIHADCADADWQAIADELNAELGCRTCHIVTDGKGWWECDACDGSIYWDSCDVNDPPACDFCPNCGRNVVER